MIPKWWNLLRPLPPHARRGSEPLTALGARLPEEPLVSVVMTCHNSGSMLITAMQSILSQSWQKLDFIVVDDASSDDTHQILLAIAATDDRVKPVRLLSNVGTYIAKNHGLTHAKGQAVTFMDSDDICDPQRIARQLQPLRDDTVVATTCNYIRKDEAGNTVLNRGLAQRQALISLMFKREVIDDIGGHDPVRIAADDEFFERLRLIYGRAAHRNIAEPLYTARVRANSLSQQPGSGVRLDTSTAGLSPPRADYQRAYACWHKQLLEKGYRPYIDPADSKARPFPVMPEILEMPSHG